MERLYTPWRSNYIQDPTEQKKNLHNDCIFCDIYENSIQFEKKKDMENLLLYRTKNIYILLNRYPYNSGHLLILPIEHCSELVQLSEKTRFELMQFTTYTTELLKMVYSPQAFNIGVNMGKVAGGSIAQHLHIHVVPRWTGDANFMPIIGETKTLPEELGVTYQRLQQAMQKFLPEKEEEASDRLFG